MTLVRLYILPTRRKAIAPTTAISQKMILALTISVLVSDNSSKKIVIKKIPCMYYPV